MAEPTISEQANGYLVGEVSHGELRRWVFDRMELFFQPELDGTPDSALAALLIGFFSECDLDREILGAADEEEFRKSLAAHPYLRDLRAS